ncbi:DegT/DnrJ/EryC1/StrS family aminotransferase [Enterovibrio calviensis]|uniref:DegT/DnrJ/EryC1/StrS family aminotransferase n=1 Tax=Enterovibrio calviensis TaxID=91359 RepID=UPI0004855865|nr:DegT/DnrJ/EryC1/StrS family aminotransferase [Enterovibrio calviensis]
MNPIPLNDTSRITGKLIPNVLTDLSDIIASGRWLLGEHGNRFASEFAHYVGAKYCVPLANGTDALEIALKCVSNGTRKEVITVANAGGYTSTACFLSGLTPVYIDVDEDSMLMDQGLLEHVISENTLAVVVTHLYGRAVNVHAVRKQLDSLGYQHVVIIEDCAQAHGAKVGEDRVGSMGDLATFSFYPTKNLGAVGDAGAITTNSEDFQKKVKSLCQYGWSAKYQIDLKNGRNSRMDEIQAAILSRLLPELDAWNSRRREIYRRYSESCKSLGFYNDFSDKNVVHLAIVRTGCRNAFVDHMRAHSILVDIHYPILDSDQDAWKDDVLDSELNVSRQLTQEIVTLPCFPMMTDEEVNYICDVLNSWDNV